MDADVSFDEQPLRTLLISDVHLGCRYAQPWNLLTFLQRYRPQSLFIVGDFLDGWKLSSSWRWSPTYTQLVRRILDLAKSGTELYYTPGNHDAFLRCHEVRSLVECAGVDLRISDEFVFDSLHGRRFLVTHGDHFDAYETRYPRISAATSLVYDPLMSVSWCVSRARQLKDRSPYSPCVAFKDAIKKAVQFTSAYQKSLLQHALRRRCDGVICGHIHAPAVVVSKQQIYVNTGDWVENCTALVERLDGTMYLESFYESVARQAIPARDSHEIDPRRLPTDVAGRCAATEVVDASMAAAPALE